jgi:hypothetical protein
MRKRYFVLATLLLTAFALGACTAGPIQPASPTQPDGGLLTKIQIAATAQAQVNLLQKEAYELEKTLEEKLPDKYTGMLVKSGDAIRVDVYLTNGSIEDLKPFVSDPELLKVIQIVPTEASRKAMREYREMIKTKLGELGTEITTSILMEPARLEIYTTDKAKTARVLEENQITLPAYTQLIEQTVLETGG